MQAGEKRGPYVLVSPVGAGGMGEVWKARDTRLDRIVAMKFSAERFSDRFEREARAVAALNHPHVCAIFDVGPDYLVMEYVDGAPVHGPLPAAEVLRLGAQIAAALQAAHAKGIVHRDLKPGNILVTKAGAKLLDFGLARLTAQAAAVENTATIGPITRENTIVGTLRYMAPEQLEGKTADARSDIFSFGLVLYEMVAGKPAFEGASQASLLAAILKEEPPAFVPSAALPRGLDRVIRKCLAKDPDARWQSAGDLHDELEWIAREVQAPDGRPAVRRSRWRWLPPVAALAIGAAAGIAWQARRSHPAANWSATQFEGPTLELAPRLSPDNSLLAFQTSVGQNTQLAVMRSDGSGWTLLTRDNDSGYVAHHCWSTDGSKLYFDRFWDRPRGIWSIPALGGQARKVLDDAWGPEALPDGSLIVAKPVAEGDYQLFHFWPDSGRTDALPAMMDRLRSLVPVRAFPDGKEVVFFGDNSVPGSRKGRDALYALDLTSKTARPLGRSLPFSSRRMSFALAPDGKSVLVLSASSDLLRLMKVPRDGAAPEEVVLTFPNNAFPWTVEAARDGSIYVDQVIRRISALRLNTTGGVPEEKNLRIYSPANLLPISPSEFLFAEFERGRLRLAIGGFDTEPRPFLQNNDESSGPMALLPGGAVAFALWSTHDKHVSVASKDGRILHRLPIDSGAARGLSASPDGRVLYYALGGRIWSAPADGSGVATKIIEGDDVTAEPTGRFLYVRQIAAEPGRVVRVSLGGGPAEAIELPGDLHLTTDPMPSGSADAKGRLLLETASPNSFFFRPAMFDPADRSVKPIRVNFDGDVWGPVWLADGRILAMGGHFSSTMWHYQMK